MKTEKDTILRMAGSFAQPHPHLNNHWYALYGTRGRVEWKRAERDLPKLWLADAQMHDLAEVDWRWERTDAPPEARGSGHGDADYYVHAAFRDAVLGIRPLEFDVYKAMDTAAPAILAADSIDQGQPAAGGARLPPQCRAADGTDALTFDIVLRGGTVIDGSGQPGRVTDVGITGDRIAALGDLAAATTAQTLDATGMVVAPGFIDIHTHSDFALLVDPRGESKLRQGVTTEVIGNCSYSAYPVRDRDLPALRATLAHLGATDVDWAWTDLAGYRQRFNARGAALNVVPLAGHGALRVAAMGYAQRPPSRDELATMQGLLADTMEQGAFGLSVGLTLVPSSYAETEELVELCRIAVRYGGYYAAHQREDPQRQLDARRETLEIARHTGIAVHMAHNNIFGRPFWHLVPEMLSLLEQEAASGVDVTYDVYPYLAGMATIDEVLPGWAQEGGVSALVERLRDPPTRRRIYKELAPGRADGMWPWDWTQIRVTTVEPPEDRLFEGKTVAEVAALLGVDGLEALLTLAERDRATATFHALSEENTRLLLQHSLGMVGSDGNAVTIDSCSLRGRPHPRFFGTFPRLLGRYVRLEQVLSLAEAIRKITSAPAARLRLHDRGLLAPAKVADIVVFDPHAVMDHATFEAPNQYASGVDTVLVSGAAGPPPWGRDGCLAGPCAGACWVSTHQASTDRRQWMSRLSRGCQCRSSLGAVVPIFAVRQVGHDVEDLERTRERRRAQRAAHRLGGVGPRHQERIAAQSSGSQSSGLVNGPNTSVGTSRSCSWAKIRMISWPRNLLMKYSCTPGRGGTSRRQVDVGPVAARHGIGDLLRTGLNHATDPALDRGADDVVRTQCVDAECLHRIVPHHRHVDDRVHAARRVQHLGVVRHVDLAHLVRRARARGTGAPRDCGRPSATISAMGRRSHSRSTWSRSSACAEMAARGPPAPKMTTRRAPPPRLRREPRGGSTCRRHRRRTAAHVVCWLVAQCRHVDRASRPAALRHPERKARPPGADDVERPPAVVAGSPSAARRPSARSTACTASSTCTARGSRASTLSTTVPAAGRWL